MTHGKTQVISRTASRQKTDADATFEMINERLQRVSGDTFTPTLPFATGNPPRAPSIPEGWSGSEGSGATAAHGSRLPKGS
eukprot:3841804-Prorocentrum_lima.AAC.1